jgi:hypothetical protein
MTYHHHNLRGDFNIRRVVEVPRSLDAQKLGFG